MIIHGGEPPVIETPEPRFGAVISKLNKITEQVEQSVGSYNQGTRDLITSFTANLSTFIAEAIAPIDAHLNAKGAVHGETSKTVGLGKKDNYRMATLAEQTALTPVNAFVSPQGAKQSLAANAKPYQLKDYQQNDVFQMASYYVPDEYPVGVPTSPQPTNYFTQSPFLTLVTNGDRLVASPVASADAYQKNSIFVSGPTATAGGSQFSEIQNLNTRYTGYNWNAIGAMTTQGKVALFKPLADKQVYEFKQNLQLTGGNHNFQLYRGYASATYKGLVTAVAMNGLTLTIENRPFKADMVSTDPTLVSLVDSNYLAKVTGMGKEPYTTPLNGKRSYNVADFVELSSGQTLSFGGNGAQGVVTSLFWKIQDYELCFMVVVPLTLKSGNINKFFNLVFVESIIPGTLLPGGSATITQLGTLVKDKIGSDLSLQGTPQWLSVSDLADFNNPALFPGSILRSGEIVKVAQGKYGIRVKRAKTGKTGIAEWATNPRPPIEASQVRTEVYAPSRHAPLQMLPERLIPIQHSEEGITYLSYALNRETGKFDWNELTWGTGSPIGVEKATLFGLRAPNTQRLVDLFNLPRSLSVYVGKTVDGAAFNGLVFSEDNNYTGYAEVNYAEGKVTLGQKVTLAMNNLFTLRTAAIGMRSNAMTANPTVNEALRETQIQVYAVTPNQALVLLTDGLCYAEAALCGYTVNGASCSLTFPSTGLVTRPVTRSGQAVNGVSRVSNSGDGVRMTGSDLLAVQETSNSWQFVVSKPFGELYGDLSFSVSNADAAAPTFTPRTVNPARCFAGAYQFDMVEELHPPILIPRKGVYQCNPNGDVLHTNMVEVGGTLQVDPYEIGEAGWVFIPAGSKVMILGRGYVLNQEYPIKVDPAGTTYCYLRREPTGLTALTSTVMRDTTNSEVLFGIAVNGVLRINNSYLILDNHLISATRRGTAIPAFDDDGGNGVNRFFTKRDIIT